MTALVQGKEASAQGTQGAKGVPGAAGVRAQGVAMTQAQYWYGFQEVCDRDACTHAIQEFYAHVPQRIADRAATCRCSAQKATYSDCLKFTEIFR